MVVFFFSLDRFGSLFTRRDALGLIVDRVRAAFRLLKLFREDVLFQLSRESFRSRGEMVRMVLRFLVFFFFSRFDGFHEERRAWFNRK